MQKGNQMTKRAMLFLALAMTAAAAAAQAPAAQTRPQQAGAAAPAPVVPDPGKIYSAAVAAARAVDAGQAGRLWDEAAAITKRSVKRDAFIEGIGKLRTTLGAVSSRDWISVARQRGGQNGLPAGNYASVEFGVTVSGGRAARELVSFRLDDDGVWRFTGYTIVR